MNSDGGSLLAIVLAEHRKNVERGALAGGKAELALGDGELRSIGRGDGTCQRACTVVGDGIALGCGLCAHLTEGRVGRRGNHEHGGVEVEVEALEVVQVVVVAGKTELIVACCQTIDGIGGKVVHLV